LQLTSKPGIFNKKVLKQFNKGFLQGIIYNWFVGSSTGPAKYSTILTVMFLMGNL